MANLILVQGDTAPAIKATISDTTGSVVNLTTAQGVKIYMRRAGDSGFAISKSCTITDATNGKVQYQPVANELSVPGQYTIVFEITWSDATIQSTTNLIQVTVNVK